MGESKKLSASPAGTAAGKGSRLLGAGLPRHEAMAWTLTVSLALGSLGCASAPEPSVGQGSGPQSVTQSGPSPPPQHAQPPAPSPPRRGTEPVVIQQGGQETQPKGLAAVAQVERQRRLEASAPMVTIDDQNLGSHADGPLTFTDSPAFTAQEGSSTVPPRTGDGLPEGPLGPLDEARWRERVRNLRLDWRDAVEQIEELEKRAAELRHRFYATDDPRVREGQIKPAWDHALESLQRARREARQAEARLELALLEGNQAGALPGWLRDGQELEPARTMVEPAASRDDGELVVVEPRIGEEEDGWP